MQTVFQIDITGPHARIHWLPYSKKEKVIFCGLSWFIKVSRSKLVASNRNKGVQYYRIESSCPYFFNYGRRPDFSKRNKCSNHLARCKAVSCSADVWKYHMADHYDQCHPLLTLPDEFVISDVERNSINTFESK